MEFRKSLADPGIRGRRLILLKLLLWLEAAVWRRRPTANGALAAALLEAVAGRRKNQAKAFPLQSTKNRRMVVSIAESAS
jgi:hypothetical protein